MHSVIVAYAVSLDEQAGAAPPHGGGTGVGEGVGIGAGVVDVESEKRSCPAGAPAEHAIAKDDETTARSSPLTMRGVEHPPCLTKALENRVFA